MIACYKMAFAIVVRKKFKKRYQSHLKLVLRNFLLMSNLSSLMNIVKDAKK